VVYLASVQDSCLHIKDQAVGVLCVPRPPHIDILKVRFWGWSENKREELMDIEEMRDRAAQGLPLYGTSYQPEWVQQAASRNSQWSQLKFCKHVGEFSNWFFSHLPF
jgi:hypothetical protein